tara:strand:+ start:834 stop:5417 length:4584 start_codon:yes stop_codon:yes gene_type:complete
MKKILSIIVMMICLGVSGESIAQCADRPIINDFTPQTGFIGSTVTITGANFSAIPANNQVFFGATQATIVSSSFGTLEVRVPEGSTTALISVKNQCNLSAYSKTHFNGIFCPTPLTSTSYQNVAQELAGVYGAYNMISQDMDNDGKPEVVSAGLNRGVTIAKNNSTPGNISFSVYNFPTNTRTVATADFDGDGLKDVVTNASVLRNTSTGPGNFGLAYAVDSKSVSGYQIGAGDFNNDGKIDIIGSHGSGIYVAFNTSTGPGNFNFTSRQFIANTGHCTGIQVADVDGDGKTDFLGSQGGANRAVSIRNTTVNGSLTASFETPEYWASNGSYPYRAMIADFDKDGKIDFTSCNYSGATNTAIWRNTSSVGNISFASTVNLPSPGANYRIGVGDVDGDGYPDIVTKSLGINVFSVYKNTSSAPGTISFAPRFDYTSSSRAEVSGIVIGDLDGDFVPDIATSGINSNTIRFHRNTGAQNDVTPPTVVCKNIVVALSPAGTVTITSEMIDNGSGDACGIDSLVLSQTDFTCADIGENTVTLTATDGAGNQSFCTATVNVQPAAIIVVGQSTVCQGETVEMNANDGDSYQWSNNGVAITGATAQSFTATASGSYTVNVTNAGGCSGESLPTLVVVNDNPTVDISPSGNAFLCPPNNSTTLTATQSSIYQWMKDGVDITNATQQTYNVTAIGSYSVRVIDLFGCSAISDATVISANPAEIDVTGDGNYGNVFPNQDYTRTITISNTGTGSLDISNLAVTGADAGSFTLSGFSTPGAIAQDTSATVDVTFNAPDITTYSAQLSFNSNDCDEGFISIPLNAEITCVAAAFSAVPSNIPVNNDAGICGAMVNYIAEATGNPTSTITYSFSGDTQGSGNGTGTNSLFNVGTTTVTLNATNPCGNVTESFDVTVTDNEAPTAIAQDITVTLNEFGGATITADDIDNGSFDNCMFTLSLDVNKFDCTNIGLENTVTLTITDASGNTNSTTANVTILEHFKETLDLRSLSSFEAFTGTGAVTNSGNFTGNVGTNAGALTGFTGPNFNGNVHLNDALTAQAIIDLMKVYIHLNNILVTHPGTHASAFGSGETLTPGVYDIGSAGSLAGNLTLDGLGDPNAVFIMKFKGAFTAGVGSNIVLTHGADAANVFWVAQGAISVGANSAIKGTLFAHPGAITLGVNSTIEGRLISSVGAITVGVDGTAMMPGAMNIPINPMVSYTPATTVDVLGSIENFSLFTSNGAVANASTSGIFGDVGADVGAISGFATSGHIGSFYNTDAVTAQAKIDLNNAYTQLMLIPTTESSHTPAFGSGETLQPGVYATAGAGSLAGTITLDGQNNSDAIFIFKFNGVFAAGALSKVIMSNGTRRCNVFWISEGAASIGSFSTLKGTIIAHNGAATMGAGGNLEGRLLSTGGAIGFSTGVVYTVVHDVECNNNTTPKTTVKEAVEEILGANDTEDFASLVLYPNPADHQVHLSNPTQMDLSDVTIYDLTGRIVNKVDLSTMGSEITIDVSSLANAPYLLVIKGSQGTSTKTLIINNY